MTREILLFLCPRCGRVRRLPQMFQVASNITQCELVCSCGMTIGTGNLYRYGDRLVRASEATGGLPLAPLFYERLSGAAESIKSAKDDAEVEKALKGLLDDGDVPDYLKAAIKLVFQMIAPGKFRTAASMIVVFLFAVYEFQARSCSNGASEVKDRPGHLDEVKPQSTTINNFTLNTIFNSVHAEGGSPPVLNQNVNQGEKAKDQAAGGH